MTNKRVLLHPGGYQGDEVHGALVSMLVCVRVYVYVSFAWFDTRIVSVS